MHLVMWHRHGIGCSTTSGSKRVSCKVYLWNINCLLILQKHIHLFILYHLSNVINQWWVWGGIDKQNAMELLWPMRRWQWKEGCCQIRFSPRLYWAWSFKNSLMITIVDAWLYRSYEVNSFISILSRVVTSSERRVMTATTVCGPNPQFAQVSYIISKNLVCNLWRSLVAFLSRPLVTQCAVYYYLL